MSGRRQFTNGEADRLRAILTEQPRTKTTRDKLRAIGFYITDFGLPSPFTVADFDRLIGSGEIIITDAAAASIMRGLPDPNHSHPFRHTKEQRLPDNATDRIASAT